MRTINIPLSQHIRHTGVLVASDNVDRLIVPLLTICKESDIIKMSRACFDIIELHIFIQATLFYKLLRMLHRKKNMLSSLIYCFLIKFASLNPIKKSVYQKLNWILEISVSVSSLLFGVRVRNTNR